MRDDELALVQRPSKTIGQYVVVELVDGSPAGGPTHADPFVGIIDELEVRPDGEFDFTLKEGQVRYS